MGLGLGWGYGAAWGSNYIVVDPEFEEARVGWGRVKEALGDSLATAGLRRGALTRMWLT